MLPPSLTTTLTIIVVVMTSSIHSYSKRTIILNDGHNFQMTCKSPDPDSLVVWQKTSNASGIIESVNAISPFANVKSMKGIRLSHDGFGNYSLRIERLSQKDAGDYVCLAVSSGNDARCVRLRKLFEISLQILVAPVITLPNSGDKRVHSGELVSLTCSAIGWPEPIVYWKRQYGQNLPVAVGDTEYPFSVLEFKATPKFAGVYECMAFNGVGLKAVKPVKVVVSEAADSEKRTDGCAE